MAWCCGDGGGHDVGDDFFKSIAHRFLCSQESTACRPVISVASRFLVNEWRWLNFSLCGRQ